MRRLLTILALASLLVGPVLADQAPPQPATDPNVPPNHTLKSLNLRDDQPMPDRVNRITPPAPTVGPLQTSKVFPSSLTLNYRSSVALAGANASIVDGNYAFCAVGGGLVVLDITNTWGPSLVKELPLVHASLLSNAPSAEFTSMAKTGNYLLMVAQMGGLFVIDVSSPANPVHVTTSTYFLGARSWSDILLDGSYAYVCANDPTYGGLYIFDISTPSAPVGVGSYLGSRQIPTLEKLGNYVYVSDRGYGTLEVIDVSTPSAPTSVYTDGTGVPFWDMQLGGLSGNYLYCISLWGMSIYDVTIPSTPIFAGGAATAGPNGGGTCIDRFTVPFYDQYFLFGINEARFQVFDIFNPTAPTPTSLTYTSTYVNDIQCYGTRACISADESIRLYDLFTPALPVSTDSVFVCGYDLGVDLQGNYLYVGALSGGLKVFDISDPTSPVRMGEALAQSGTGAGYLDVVGNYAYVPSFSYGLTRVNVSNPAAPVTAGSYDTPGDANHVVVRGNYAYLADYGGGLQIIDISNPISMTLAGAYLGSSNVARVAISGNYAYLGCRGEGLKIVDISNPAAPVFVGGTTIQGGSGDVRGVAVSGNYAYVAADGSIGTRIVDCTNPAAPVELAGAVPGIFGDPFGITVSGSRAYVAHWGYNGWGRGITVLDISNPASPTLEATYTDVNGPRWIAVQDTVMAFGDQTSVQILSFQAPCCYPAAKLRGDVSTSGGTLPNGDGGTDGSDLGVYVDYVFLTDDSSFRLDCAEVSDLNNDASTDGGDLGILVDYIFFNDTSVIKRCDGSPF